MSFGSSPYGSNPFGSYWEDNESDFARGGVFTVANVENFFWLNPSRDEDFFDETPHNRVLVTARNSSSIDTSAIDGYRQGIEIRSMKHFDAGTIKIHAGEEGHFVKRNTFGLNHVYFEKGPFKDSGGRDPVQFIGSTSSRARQVTAQPFISVPPPTELSSREFDRFLYDGVVDFLGVRRRDIMLRTHTPIDTRGVVGEIQDGNVDEKGGTNQIVSVYEWSPAETRERPFFDDPTLFDQRWTSNASTTSILSGSRVSPFNDVLAVNVTTSSQRLSIWQQGQDSTTVAYYPMTSSIIDYTPYNTVLTSVGASHNFTSTYPGATGSFGGRIGAVLSIRSSGTVGTQLFLTGAMTFEFFIAFASVSALQQILLLGGAPTEGNENFNVLASLAVTGSRLRWYQETSGSSTTHTFTSQSLFTSQSMYLAITRDDIGVLRMYHNGALVETSPTYTLPSLGVTPTTRLTFSSAATGSVTSPLTASTIWGGLKLSNVARTSAQILAVYSSSFIYERLNETSLSAYLPSASRGSNMLSDKERSATSGWDYDSVAGTDSIAFGGMTY